MKIFNFKPHEKTKWIGIHAYQYGYDEYMFFASDSAETHNGDVHVHIVLRGTKRIDEFLLLRDYLLSHPDEAKAYSDYKRKLIKDGVIDRKEYKRIKADYVSELIERAIQNGRN